MENIFGRGGGRAYYLWVLSMELDVFNVSWAKYFEVGHRFAKKVCTRAVTSLTWGVQVLRSPNFFLGEWKQIET